jgi:small subunit ribosomal protein S2
MQAELPLHDADIHIDLEDKELEQTEDIKAFKEGKDEINDLLDKVNIQTLFENHWHVGDKRSRRGPYMGAYIFATKTGTDIIDLNKTSYLFKKALIAVRKAVSRGEKVLFVGTESHTANLVKSHAERCAQYSIHRRWLGGLLTNWNNTFSSSINEMKKLQKQIEEGEIKHLTKREQMSLIRKRDRFLKFLDCVKDMSTLPGIVVVTSNREKNVIKEAQILGIPVILLMDTTSNPEKIAFPVPGNDRSIKVTEMFCSLIADACLLGLKDELTRVAKRQEKKQAAIKNTENS